MTDEQFQERLPIMCATRHVTTGNPIMIKRGETGYWALYEDFDVEGYNRRRGITPAQIEAMEIGSMFGWDVPGVEQALLG